MYLKNILYLISLIENDLINQSSIIISRYCKMTEKEFIKYSLNRWLVKDYSNNFIYLCYYYGYGKRLFNIYYLYYTCLRIHNKLTDLLTEECNPLEIYEKYTDKVQLIRDFIEIIEDRKYTKIYNKIYSSINNIFYINNIPLRLYEVK